MTFAALDVTEWELHGLEQRGVTPHPWLRRPADEELFLWKPAAGPRLARREHWAEKLASAVAGILGLPCAEVDLAVRDGVPGCVSRNFQPHGDELLPGSLLLAAIDPSFRPDCKGHAAYTVDHVAAVLADVVVDPHPELPADLTAFDVFTGFLLFDALVMNRDRHAANWAILRRRSDTAVPDRLCPLYDNASSFALSVTDEVMRRRLDSRGVAAYVARECFARPFARVAQKPVTLFDVANQAWRLSSPRARNHWRERFGRLAAHDVARLAEQLPQVSEVLPIFVEELISVSQQRLVADVFGT